MTISANDCGALLIEQIQRKDAQLTAAIIQQFKAAMADPTVGAEYVTWISEPVNLSRVHQALTKELNIPQRAMAIKRRLMSRTQRAVCLIQAMEIAVKRAYSM